MSPSIISPPILPRWPRNILRQLDVVPAGILTASLGMTIRKGLTERNSQVRELIVVSFAVVYCIVHTADALRHAAHRCVDREVLQCELFEYTL